VRLATEDSPNCLCGCQCASLLINQASLAELQRFPFKQANPIDILAGQFKPIGHAFSRVVRRRLPPGLPLMHFAPQHFPNQRLLVPKIMVQHPLIDGCAPGNTVHTGARKPVCREFIERRFEDPLLGAFRISRAGLDGFTGAFQASKGLTAAK